MKGVISVVGGDSVGIIAKVSSVCVECQVNILEISQTVLQEYFAMIMVTDISAINIPFTEFVDRMHRLGRETHLEINAVHEDIFNAMHRI